MIPSAPPAAAPLGSWWPGGAHGVARGPSRPQSEKSVWAHPANRWTSKYAPGMWFAAAGRRT